MTHKQKIRRVNLLFAGGYTLVVMALVLACYCTAPRYRLISQTTIKGRDYNVYRDTSTGMVIYRERGRND